MLKSTIVLDDIFDSKKGWEFPPHQVPLIRKAAEDGNPYYEVTVDGTELAVFEQTEWKTGVESNVSATRLVVKSYISVENITNPAALAEATSETNGLPSFGLDSEGYVTVQVALPFSEKLPLEWLRKQVMVCMGLVAEETKDFISGVNEPDSIADEEQSSDWNVAKDVASVAGFLLRVFDE